MIRLGTLTENRETSLFLCARFPRLASDSNPSGEPFQRLWLNFYGDAFETFESDFVIAKVNEYKELPDKLTDRESVINALETGLYKLQLTYKPGKVVTKAVDGPDAFSMPESSHSAQLFRSLVECEMPTTLTLYFDHDPAPGDLVIDLMNKLRDRLQYEKDAEPSVEYRNKKGKIVLVIEVLVHQPKLTVSGFNMASRFSPMRRKAYFSASWPYYHPISSSIK